MIFTLHYITYNFYIIITNKYSLSQYNSEINHVSSLGKTAPVHCRVIATVCQQYTITTTMCEIFFSFSAAHCQKRCPRTMRLSAFDRLQHNTAGYRTKRYFSDVYYSSTIRSDWMENKNVRYVLFTHACGHGSEPTRPFVECSDRSVCAIIRQTAMVIIQ